MPDYDWAGRFQDNAGSDKVYRVRIVGSGDGTWLCQRYWGRIGRTPHSMTTTHPTFGTAYDEACKLANEKRRHGYDACDLSLVPVVEVVATSRQPTPERSERARKAALKAWETIRAKQPPRDADGRFRNNELPKTQRPVERPAQRRFFNFEEE